MTKMNGMKPLNILLVKGGWSLERDVSLSSGQEIAAALSHMGHNVHVFDLKDDRSSVMEMLVSFVNAEMSFDVVFNALHGTGGEDGVLQGCLDTFKIPYTHSGLTACVLAMNKVLSKRLFEASGLTVTPWCVMSRQELLKKDALSHARSFFYGSSDQGSSHDQPIVIKPVANGSSRGVFILKDDTLPFEFFEDDWAFGEELLVEQYIGGQELSVAVMGGKALGVIEIAPKVGFYDYNAKYTDGLTIHRMPAPLFEKDYEKTMHDAVIAHKTLGCHGISRVDFLYQGGQHYVLEVNTHPGMTPLSLFPEIAQYVGLSFYDVLQYLLDHATYRHDTHPSKHVELSSMGDDRFSSLLRVV